jgi:ligand-binding sensor domain-containing protein/serine phosphatase RsbU (regulator of sigma subunit)
MKFHLPLYFTIIILLFSCNPQNKKSNTRKIKVVEAKGYLVPQDSMAEPKVIVAGKPAKVKAGNPKIVATNTNILKVPKIQKTKCGKPQIIELGSDTFSLPKKVKAIGKKVVCKTPNIVPASPLSTRDNSTNNIQYLDMEHGMNSYYVKRILQDKRGNLWFGSYGGGVSKYNGSSFTHFTEKEGLSNNIVRSIFEDKKGNLWFGTEGGGVTKYNGEYFTQFTKKEGLSNNYVLSILEDKNGNLWFGTWGGGVCKYDGEYFTNYNENEGLNNNTIYSILEDKTGNLWFGTNGGGVCKFDGKSFTNYTEKEGLISNYVCSILEDKKGNLWFGSYGGGVCKFDGIDFLHFTKNEGLIDNTVISILEDKKGDMWFGTSEGGVVKYDGVFFTNYSENEGLSNTCISSIIEDTGGNLWFGTYGGGVCKYKRESFLNFTDKEGLSVSWIWSIIEDKKGNMWFGTLGGGICKYDGSYFYQYSNNEGLVGNSVKSILEDKDGNLWFGGSGGGVSKYDGEYFTHYTEKEGLTDYPIMAMLEDKNKNIWFAAGQGVYRFDGNSFTHFTKKQGLSSDYVLSIEEDKEGNLWFGTIEQGINKYDGKNFTQFNLGVGSGNTVNSIVKDKSDNLWFGTAGGGVCKYNGKYFYYYTENDGLSNNTVNSLLEVPSVNPNQTNLFVATNNGLNYISTSYRNDIFSKSSKVQKTIVFKKNDGLKINTFLENVAFMDSKGNAWWGNTKSLIKLNVNNFKVSKSTPTIHLNQIKINDNYINYRSLLDTINDSLKIKFLNKIEFNRVENFYNYPIELILKNDFNHLTFEYNGFDWADQDKLQYQFKLEGLEKDWNLLTAENKADYRNIPYGTYTFKVKAIGIAGKWSSISEYSFQILPPWYQTKWAYAGYVLAFLGIVIGFNNIRTKQLKLRQQQLERTVEERTIEVVNEKKVVVEQKHLIEEKHKEITDSINYAERIQRSFLATKELLDENLSSFRGTKQSQTNANILSVLDYARTDKDYDLNYERDYFVFFQPKDVVSGDFYWASNLPSAFGRVGEGLFILVTADSTGHGVPGAIMSLLNITSLESAIKDGFTEPSDILNATRKTIIERLKKDGSSEGGKDGMDASLICFDFANSKFTYAAANNPIWVVRANELIELKPDKMPLGKHDKDYEPFIQHDFEMQKGDVVYTLTDGLPDQFGGQKGKKFMYKKLKELLVSIAGEPMEKQKQILADALNTWKGDLEQVDDVCLIGVRV